MAGHDIDTTGIHGIAGWQSSISISTTCFLGLICRPCSLSKRVVLHLSTHSRSHMHLHCHAPKIAFSSFSTHLHVVFCLLSHAIFWIFVHCLYCQILFIFFHQLLSPCCFFADDLLPSIFTLCNFFYTSPILLLLCFFLFFISHELLPPMTSWPIVRWGGNTQKPYLFT